MIYATRRSFEFSWRAITGSTIDSALPILWGRIVEAYEEEHRHYHTLDHLEHCLNLWRVVRHLADHPEEVVIALWYHDYFYNPTAHNNELLSARVVGRIAEDHGTPPTVRRRIEDLVAATDHDPKRRVFTDDERLLIGIDLSILASHPDTYREYVRGVRLEYEHVPDDAFRAGRAAILKGMLGRQAIYENPDLYGMFEVGARRNLTAELAELEAAR